VFLRLHGVQNVQHGLQESYYGLASIQDDECEHLVLAGAPTALCLGVGDVLALRVLLGQGDSPQASSRTIGQVTIPVREMLTACGTGIYRTWFLLDDAQQRKTAPREGLAESFSRSLLGVPFELHAPRVCLTLFEVSIDPCRWDLETTDWEECYGPLLVSHQQHVRAVQAYFETLEMRREDPRASRRRDGCRGDRPSPSSAGAGTVQAALLLLAKELERLQEEEMSELLREHWEAEGRLASARCQRARLLAKLGLPEPGEAAK